MASKKVVEPVAPAPQTGGVEITLQSSPDAANGLAIRANATQIAVVDKQSHEDALLYLRGAKQLERRITEHWQRITRNVDDLKRSMLDLKRKDLAPVEEAIRIVERQCLDFQAAENRRVREEEDRRRQAAEEQARKDREALLRKMEAEALKAEANSPNLSPREEAFVRYIIDEDRTGMAAAQAAGYKDPAGASARLLDAEKIQKAMGARKKAIELRQQQQAERNRPLDVVTKNVERQTAKVSGTRNTVTYSARVDNVGKLWDAVMAGSVGYSAFTVDEVWLNGQARQLKDAFESCFPGCTLIKKEGIAG